MHFDALIVAIVSLTISMKILYLKLKIEFEFIVLSVKRVKFLNLHVSFNF